MHAVGFSDMHALYCCLGEEFEAELASLTAQEEAMQDPCQKTQHKLPFNDESSVFHTRTVDMVNM